MNKSITILILSVLLTAVTLLYLFNPRVKIIKPDHFIIRDTILRTDTVFLTKVQPDTKRIHSSPVIARENEKNKDSVNPYRDAEFTSKVIPSEGYTFGYEILMNGRLFIHQPNIPGLPGNAGFKNRETATRVANLVIDKIRKNEMPPSITPQELKKINALK